MSYQSRVPPGPHISIHDIHPGSVDPAHARRAALALGYGEVTPRAVHPPPGRATRRGDLPDVDFSQAIRLPRRSLWNRILQALRVRVSEAPAQETPQILEVSADDLAAPAAKVIQFRRAA